MSRSRRFFDPNDDRSSRGPSDEMLAVDAASEPRSMTLLYERWADRLYRYFLLSTGDPAIADRMMRDLIARLPGDLQRFAGEDRSFAGWLFGRASDVFWREYSFPSRMYRRFSRYLPAHGGGAGDGDDDSVAPEIPGLSGFDEISDALLVMPPDRREVLGVQYGAALHTSSGAEALKLPASLIASHVRWSMEALAEQLGVTNNRRLSENLEAIISRQSLTSQQRQRHFALIHGVFLGEVEVEQEEPDRLPVFEIAALVGVVVVGLLGIWVWGLISEGDTREHEVASPGVETVADDGFDPVPTAEPEPSPSPELTPTEDEGDEVGDVATGGASTCPAAEGRAGFDRFVSYFNNADFASVHQMLPNEAVQVEDIDSDEPASFFVHGATSLDNRFAVSSFLRDRYNDGERWDVLEAYPAEHYRNWQAVAPLEMYQDWKRNNPGRSMIIVAGMDVSGDSSSQEIASGRVVIDCETNMVVSWELNAHSQQRDPVSVTDFLETMEPLEPGELRSVVAQVRVDSRPDGGLLQNWGITWVEAMLDDGTETEWIEVHALNGTGLISYLSDGDEWRLNQRGWVMAGDAGEDVMLPDEILLPMEWLPELPELIEEMDVPVDALDDGRQEFSIDISAEGPTGIERELTLEIENGSIGPLTLRESTPTDERIRPEMRIVAINRAENFSEDVFRVDGHPGFPAVDLTAPRYRVPDGALSQLELVEAIDENDQTQESYVLRLNNVEFTLVVYPSRGGFGIESIPPAFDESWSLSPAEYRWGTLIWASRQFAGYPTDAIWDDGRYLFALAVDRESVSGESDWDLQELITLVDVLSMDLEGGPSRPPIAGNVSDS